MHRSEDRCNFCTRWFFFDTRLLLKLRPAVPKTKTVLLSGPGKGENCWAHPKKVNLAHSLFYVTQIHNGAIRGRVCKCHFHRGSRPGTEGKYVVIVRPLFSSPSMSIFVFCRLQCRQSSRNHVLTFLRRRGKGNELWRQSPHKLAC